MLKRILISGSTGFVGRHLTRYLMDKGYDVFRLLRKKDNDKSIFWDPQKKLIDQQRIKNFDVVIHLSGEPVNGYWTKAKRQKIYDSRIESTKFLVDTFQRLKAVPKVFITASAIGFYGFENDTTYNEDSLAGNGFLAKICERWEEEAAKMNDARVVNLRFGHILGKDGGVLPKLKLIHKFFLGGRIGSGRQYISWVSIDDVVKIIEHVIKNEKICKAVNVTCPNFVTQAEMAKMISNLLNRPFFFHIPKFLLKLFLGKQADEMFLSSIKAFPKKLKDFNFEFEFDNLADALKHYI